MKVEYQYVKIVKIRKPHTCEACGDTIPAGSQAIVLIRKRHRLQRYPDRLYYHYLEGALQDPYEVLRISHGEFRGRVCRHLWGEEDE